MFGLKLFPPVATLIYDFFSLSFFVRNRPSFQVIGSAGGTHTLKLSAASMLGCNCPLGGATVSINLCGSTTLVTPLTGEWHEHQQSRETSLLSMLNCVIYISRLTGETVVTAFDLDKMYTPFHFARVKSYTAFSERPLWAVRRHDKGPSLFAQNEFSSACWSRAAAGWLWYVNVLDPHVLDMQACYVSGLHYRLLLIFWFQKWF